MNAEDQTASQERALVSGGQSRPPRNGSRIKVAIADDHKLVREALRMYLAVVADVECVGEASDGAEAVRLVQRNDVDVLVLDLCMPRVDGVEAIQRLLSLASEVKVVVFSSETARLPQGLREQGIVAVCLEKGCHPDDLIGAIRHAAAAGKREVGASVPRGEH